MRGSRKLSVTLWRHGATRLAPANPVSSGLVRTHDHWPYLPARTNPRLANSPLAASSYNLTIFNQLNVNDARSQRAWRPNEVDLFEDRSWHNALKEKLSRWTRLAIS